MQIFRINPLTLKILGCFILFWVFFTLVLIDIFDGSACPFVSRRVLISEPDDDDTNQQLSPGEESKAAKMSPKQIQSRQRNSNRTFSSVIAKYLKKEKGFTLYKEDLAPEDRRLLDEAELIDYPAEFPRRLKSITGMNESALLLSRENAFSSFQHHRRYYDYSNHYIVWFDQEKNFRIVSDLGRGHYCKTYVARDLKRGVDVVLKSLNKVWVHKIKRELNVLEKIKSSPHVIQLVAPVRNREGTPGFVFELEPHDNDRYFSMTIMEIKIFTKQLLLALESVHALGIMHRDVKRANLRYDFEQMRLVLIDFGLAEYYLPDGSYSVDVATKHYKAPELLLGLERYDYSVDMWSVGCLIASQVFQMEPFFEAKKKFDVVTAIGDTLGRQGMEEYIVQYNISVNHRALVPMSRISRQGRVDFRQLMKGHNLHPEDEQMLEDAIDFVDKLLVYDHRKRLTAREALRHRFITDSNPLTADPTLQ